MSEKVTIVDITGDDLTHFQGRDSAFVTFGETMVRDTPMDNERLERTRRVSLNPAGSEFTLAIMLSRLGIPSTYITRLPDNPYGWKIENIAKEQGLEARHIVWADKTESVGRFLYEMGRTPRPNKGWYQRKFSAASRLGAGMVDWRVALKDALLFHTSGITFGLSAHSGYERNYLREAFQEAIDAKPERCRVGLDFNYRATLWSAAACEKVMTPIITDNVDILITTIEDMAQIYGMHCGGVNAESIVKGDLPQFPDAALKEFMEQLLKQFELHVVGLTIRYPDSHEQHRWESAAMDENGNFYRSARARSITLLDRVGGGDTWNGGFYYGLLTEKAPAGLKKGVLVGDAATRLKQTLMYDIAILRKDEIQSLLNADSAGGGKRIIR